MAARDWNVVVTVYDGEFREALGLLARFGSARGTEYRNVVVMQVDDVGGFLDALRDSLATDASLANAVSRIVPVTRRFEFDSPEEFERRAQDAVSEWLPELAGKKFHVRMHRRGFKGRLSSQHEEQFLDHFILERLKLDGVQGAVDFDDPDVVVAVETLGQQAGLSCWTRRQLEEYELLGLD